MNCPNCAKELAEPAQECGSCGLILSKWGRSGAATAAAISIRRAEESSSATLYVLFGLFLAAAGLWRLDDGPVPEPAGVSTKGVLPGSYRAQITELESELYGSAPTLAGLDAKIEQLGQKVLERKEPDSARLFQEIVHYRQTIETIQDTAEWARRWEALRDQNFRQAPWFRSLPKPGETAQP